MRRLAAILGIACLTAAGVGQGYTENWRAITSPSQADESIRWHKVLTTPANEVIAFGSAIVGPPPPATHGPAADQAETVLVAKFAADGTPVWISRDFTTTEPNMEPQDLGVDAAGNAYVSYRAGTSLTHIASFAAGDGALRWRNTLTVANGNERTLLAVRSAGNSTFVYAGSDIDLGAQTAINLLRLNSASGAAIQILNVAGANAATLGNLSVDVNGNPIVSGQLDSDLFVRKLNQSLNTVWDKVFVGVSPLQSSFNESNNTVLVLGRTITFTTQAFLLSGVNGSTTAQREFISNEGFGTAIPSIFGSWAGAWSFTASSINGIMGLTASLQSYAMTTIPKETSALAIDTSGAAHFASVGATSGPVFAIRRAPSSGLFEPAIGASVAQTVTSDSLGRVVVSGILLDGSAIIFQLDQPFLTNTDVIVKSFTGTLNVEAPGVLGNDTNWVGGTLSVTTPPAEGTVTLNADGSFVYVPNASYDGTDQFQYRVTKNGVPRTATCVVKQLVFTQLTAPAAIVGGEFIRANGTVNNANFVGVLIPTVSISSPLVDLGGTPLLVQGRTNFAVDLRSKEVSANTNVTISMTSSGQTRSVTITLLPGGFKEIQSVENAPLIAGQSSTFILRLTGVTTVDKPIGLNYQGLNGPSAVTVPAGSSSVSFNANPTVAVGGTANIRVFLSMGPRDFSFPVTAKPKLLNFKMENGLLYAGTTFRVEAILDGLAGTSAIPVAITSNSNQVTLPATATVQAGKSNAFASGVCNLAAANTNVSFSATLDGTTKSFTILARKNLLENFTLSTNTLAPQGSATGTVFLNWVAPPGGQSVGISVDQPLLVTVPTKLVIAAGQTSGTFPIQANRKSGTVTISVVIGQKKLTRTLTITP